MSVYKPKKSPFYAYSFDLKGIRYHGSTGTKSFEEAKAVEAAKREEVRKAALYRGERKRLPMTINVAFDRYYQEVSQFTASGPNTLTYMERLLRLGAGTLLSEITDADVASLVAKRRGEKARYSKHPVSNATVNRETELLRRIFRRARDVWRVDIGDEPAWTMHILPEADERIRELTPMEEAKLFEHLREDYHPMVLFALKSGMRLSNIVRLTWRQVDTESRQIKIMMKSKKPGGRAHAIPITPAMETLLEKERGRNAIFVFTYECKKSRAKRKKGDRYPFSHDGWRKAWKEALDAAGIEDFRFHDARHTAATRIVRATGNLKVAQKLLGHTTLAATTRYAHVNHDDVLEAMLKVDHRKITGTIDKTAAGEPKKARKSEERNTAKRRSKP